MIRIKSFLLSVLATFFVVCSFSSPALSADPTEELRPTLDGIMAIITDQMFTGDEHKALRRSKIMDIAHQGFDFQMMSKLVLGKTWKTIDAQQRTIFEELFTKLLENAYIGKLEDYTGQVTKYTGERVKGKKAEVSTLMENNGLTLPVNYIMIDSGTGWKVYDIKIEGVRLLRNYRAQFKSIVKKEKFEGLVRVLEEKNADFAKEGT